MLSVAIPANNGNLQPSILKVKICHIDTTSLAQIEIRRIYFLADSLLLLRTALHKGLFWLESGRSLLSIRSSLGT